MKKHHRIIWTLFYWSFPQSRYDGLGGISTHPKFVLDCIAVVVAQTYRGGFKFSTRLNVEVVEINKGVVVDVPVRDIVLQPHPGTLKWPVGERLLFCPARDNLELGLTGVAVRTYFPPISREVALRLFDQWHVLRLVQVLQALTLQGDFLLSALHITIDKFMGKADRVGHSIDSDLCVATDFVFFGHFERGLDLDSVPTVVAEFSVNGFEVSGIRI